MPGALIASLFFTVALLVVMAYFLLGSVPLLVLKHDTPLDSRFIRGFYNIYYLGVMFTALPTAVSYAFAGRMLLAAGAAVLAVIAVVLRRTVVSRMHALGSEIHVGGVDAIPGFRRVHLTAIALNLVQLVLIVWSLMTLSSK